MYIKRAIHKYGKDKFHISLLEVVSIEKLNEREKYWIAYYDSYNNGYNLTLGGQDSNYFNLNRLENTVDIKKFSEYIKEFRPLATEVASHFGISKSSEFRNLGVNLNLAPMADVATNASSSISSRAYGDKASEILTLAKCEYKGMNDQGVDCCIKYFPGHGDVTGDTKTTRVTSQRTKEQLEQTEGIIYKGLIEEGVQMIMVSHITMPKIAEDNVPASLSSEIVTDILRTEWGFEGVIATDYMNKNAITRFYKHADAAVMAVQAGVDMIVAPGDFQKSYNGILKAVQDGEITEERINQSVERILKMKYRNVIDYEEVSGANDEELEATDSVDSSAETELI